MNSYVLLPLVSTIACAMLAVAIWTRDPTHRANRLGALGTLAVAFWGLCEVLWSVSEDPAIAFPLIRLSSFGWITVGPILLHLFMVITGHRASRNRMLLGSLYGVCTVLIGLDLFTSSIHTGIERVSWGWAYHVGPLFPAGLVLAASTLTVGLTMLVRDFGRSISGSERLQAYTLCGATVVPIVVASLTDGVFPILGIMTPRFGVASVTLMIAAIAWSFYHYGYSLFAPGAFASEILDSLVDGVALLRADGRIHFANPAMTGLAGRAAEDLVDRPFADLVRGASIDPLEEFDGRECELAPLEGQPVPVSLSSSVLRDKRGQPIGLVVVAKDLREVKSLRNRLVASDRLAAVGQLAAGIAHEINNPVAYVRSNLGSLRQILETVRKEIPATSSGTLRSELEDGTELLTESLDGVDRVAAIVKGVKGFSHVGTDVKCDVDVREILDTVLRVAAPQLPDTLEIQRRYGDVPPVRGVPQQLEQVFLNLVINAIQAVRPGDRVWIETSARAGRVSVLIEDEGCGMQPEVLERVFDPFFTTKGVGEGTGLGLSISYEIVRSHGGELSVESQPGRGSRFRVTLPQA